MRAHANGMTLIVVTHKLQAVLGSLGDKSLVALHTLGRECKVVQSTDDESQCRVLFGTASDIILVDGHGLRHKLICIIIHTTVGGGMSGLKEQTKSSVSVITLKSLNSIVDELQQRLCELGVLLSKRWANVARHEAQHGEHKRRQSVDQTLLATIAEVLASGKVHTEESLRLGVLKQVHSRGNKVLLVHEGLGVDGGGIGLVLLVTNEGGDIGQNKVHLIDRGDRSVLIHKALKKCHLNLLALLEHEVLTNAGIVGQRKNTKSIIEGINGLRQQKRKLLDGCRLTDYIGLSVLQLGQIVVHIKQDGVDIRRSVLEAAETQVLQASLKSKIVTAGKARLGAARCLRSNSCSGRGHIRSSSSSSSLGSNRIGICKIVRRSFSSKLLDASLKGLKQTLGIDR